MLNKLLLILAALIWLIGLGILIFQGAVHLGKHEWGASGVDLSVAFALSLFTYYVFVKPFLRQWKSNRHD